MASTNQEWAIRPAIGSDLNFIYSTWLNSYRSDSKIGNSTRKSIYFSHYYGVLDAILRNQRTKVLVSCKLDEPNVIFGFFVFENSIDDINPATIHYSFVKEGFRRHGILKSLFEKAFDGAGAAFFYTHQTREIEKILKENPKFLYNPFLLFSREDDQNHEETNV